MDTDVSLERRLLQLESDMRNHAKTLTEFTEAIRRTNGDIVAMRELLQERDIRRAGMEARQVEWERGLDRRLSLIETSLAKTASDERMKRIETLCYVIGVAITGVAVKTLWDFMTGGVGV